MRPNGLAGSAAPTVTTASAASSSGTLGRLRKNGMRRVRMAKITRVWVARDSTNQPDRNSAGPAWNPHSMTPKVMKSNTELTRPKKSMNLRMKPTSRVRFPVGPERQ